jgi:hypothetical protein
MVSKLLQQEIQAYSEGMNVCHRGLFLKAVQYPGWKKRLVIFLMLEHKVDPSIDKLDDFLALLPSRQDGRLLSDDEAVEVYSDDVGGFLTFLSDLADFLIIGVLSIPIMPDLVKAKITWESSQFSSLTEAMLLGSLIDPA